MLYGEDLKVAQDALMVASHNLSQQADNLQTIAQDLRNGDKVMPFMDGEPGAQAAEHMAAEKAYRAQQFDDLFQAIEDILFPDNS